MVWEGYVVDRSESTARSVWKNPGQRETRRLDTVGRLGTGSAVCERGKNNTGIETREHTGRKDI